MKPCKSTIALSFSKAAVSYDQSAALQRKIGDTLLVGLCPTQAVDTLLDLGCGTGYFSKVLKKRFPQSILIGADLAEGMLQQAKNTVNDALWVAGDAEILPFQSNSVDVVFSNLALQWCHDFSKVLDEVYRILRPGGFFLFTTLCHGTLQELKHSWQAVDNHIHVNQFMGFAEYMTLLNNSHFSIDACCCHPEVAYYPTLTALMADLKGIGAHNINPNRSKGLTTRQQIAHLIKAYEQYRDERGLPSTYQVLYGYLSKR
ncbi:malonyl-[acyl-carrier protein] O-methyltransferase BioC [Entomomonas moraniae]|uniref:Malonyl-[acyl-carrier protein] O-methyltransferase n=1 Tax=Entomomonas moraniae TaxID=2213226 RepID=A0A3Q9JKF7_9GAMM|nr:malonyl-ACP O-methyltransferase BioC [Entomomonas moraniae]AZS50256.1 malonyl-[acyl-carrier protein] O-methyltransferase BioC [Entomomonas moraniae]